MKIRFSQDLIHAGIKEFELGAFVRKDRVPQMADSEILMAAVNEGKLKLNGARPWILIPNMKGLERAIASDVKNIAVFTAATDSFNKKNIGMTVERSLNELTVVVREALAHGMKVRGYVSTAFGCPFEGKVPPSQPRKVIARLMKMGVFQVSVGDTIGVATPRDVDSLVAPLLKTYGAQKIALHFHDTRGTALANALRSLEHGVRVLDASAGGLGGCPFAPGATGNLATEDLVYLLDGLGLKTGIDLNRLCQASLRLGTTMKRPLASRYLQAYKSAGK